MKHVSIITSGYFPVPATKGGAVENIDENFLRENEKVKRLDLTVFSCFDVEAFQKSREYRNTNFVFIRIPRVIQLFDVLVFNVMRLVFRKKKTLSFRYIIQRLYYILRVAIYLKNADYGRIVLENHASLFLILKAFKNYKKYAGKYYLHLHNEVTNSYHCHTIMSRCAGVFGVSSYINEQLHRFLGKEDQNDYYVLRNRVDQNLFRPSISTMQCKDLRLRYGITNDDNVVLFTGRISEEKGISELIDAISLTSNNRVKLLAVGSYYYASGIKAPENKSLAERIAKLGKRVIFTGYVPYEEIPLLYKAADIIVLPSVWDDPAPLTVIEALTSGGALISTYSGGIPEYAEGASILLKRDASLSRNIADEIDALCENAEKLVHLRSDALKHTERWTLKLFFEDFVDMVSA